LEVARAKPTDLAVVDLYEACSINPELIFVFVVAHENRICASFAGQIPESIVGDHTKSDNKLRMGR